MVYEAETMYTLSALVSRTSATGDSSFLSLEFVDMQGSVYNSQIVLVFALPLNTFTEVSVNFNIGTSSAAIGKDIRINLSFSGTGGSVAMDRVRVCKS